MEDDKKQYKDVDEFLKDVEWGRLSDDDLLEPLDADEPIFKDLDEDMDDYYEEDYEGL